MKADSGKAHDIDVLIVGGGHNGLVAGSYLARAGLEVQVLERRSMVGGACITEELFSGFHFSSCSFMLYALHPKVADDLELHRYGFQVFQLDPFLFRPYPDGRHLVLHQDSERNAEAIGAFSRRDAESYRRWNRLWERFHSIVHAYVLTPPPAYADLVRRARETGNLEIFKKVLITSHADLVEEFFESDHVRAAMIHSGDHGDPRSIGSALPAAFLPGDVEPERRIAGIVKGGMGAVTRAMAGYLESQGGAIRTGCQVRRVLVEDGRARGVELTSGETIRSRLVVSNADPKRTFLDLVEPEHLPLGF
ncbi:MAG: NAD(P)/FAD-dependent oxidoreductase, partial [Candidatus Aminicenantes bacterium]|nr:NAD(P)/FAD-dependent oxidoreductase [Candidatus Aminicenantes bacterium]